HPLAFTWPVYRGQRLPLWKLAVGLTLYDLLSLFRNVERHRRLNPRDVLALEPRVNPLQLRGRVRYFDAATNDSRLTRADAPDAERLAASRSRSRPARTRSSARPTRSPMSRPTTSAPVRSTSRICSRPRIRSSRRRGCVARMS